jgi:hypothetical protein
MVRWRDTIDQAEPAAALVIDFAPIPVGPAMQQTEVPPGPEQTMSEATTRPGCQITPSSLLKNPRTPSRSRCLAGFSVCLQAGFF